MLTAEVVVASASADLIFKRAILQMRIDRFLRDAARLKRKIADRERFEQMLKMFGKKTIS